MNKAQGRRGKKKANYYESQKLVTIQNKNRRSAKRRADREFWAKKKEMDEKAKALVATGAQS